jgi:hypothetical protein
MEDFNTPGWPTSLSVISEGPSLRLNEQLSDFGRQYLTYGQVLYAEGDVHFLELLRQELNRLMDCAEGGSLLRVFSRDMEHLIPLARRELLGIRFDLVLANTMLGAVDDEDARLRKRLFELLGIENLTSSQVVKTAFKERLGIDLSATNKEVMKPLMETCEAAGLLRAWRTNEALRKELTRLLKLVHSDGRLYPDLETHSQQSFGRVWNTRLHPARHDRVPHHQPRLFQRRADDFCGGIQG